MYYIFILVWENLVQKKLFLLSNSLKMGTLNHNFNRVYFFFLFDIKNWKLFGEMLQFMHYFVLITTGRYLVSFDVSHIFIFA